MAVPALGEPKQDNTAALASQLSRRVTRLQSTLAAIRARVEEEGGVVAGRGGKQNQPGSSLSTLVQKRTPAGGYLRFQVGQVFAVAFAFDRYRQEDARRDVKEAGSEEKKIRVCPLTALKSPIEKLLLGQSMMCCPGD